MNHFFALGVSSQSIHHWNNQPACKDIVQSRPAPQFQVRSNTHWPNRVPRSFLDILLLHCVRPISSITRMVIFSNNVEPANGFLLRYLHRKVMEAEDESSVCHAGLLKVLDWVPKLWYHLHTFLEKHSTSDFLIGTACSYFLSGNLSYNSVSSENVEYVTFSCVLQVHAFSSHVQWE